MSETNLNQDMENEYPKKISWNKFYLSECEYIVEDTTNYYKNVLKDIRPYMEDFVAVLEGEGAGSYYSSTQKEVVNIKELRNLVRYIIDQAYGAK